MQTNSPLKSLLALLYPELCAACDRPCEDAGPFCASCTISVEPIGTCCSRCGTPLPASCGPCGGCQVRPPPYDRARALWLFGGAVATAVKRCKYADHPEIARSLGKLLPRDAARAGMAVVPVPLHPRRLRARGFNQSALIALALGTNVDTRALDRVRDTPPQAGLTAAARRHNVAGAFLARPERVRGRHVVLIDDVITTGATVEAAAVELRRAGAASVDVLTLARAVP